MDTYPPVSPDLNAVESVWSRMNRYVQRNHPRSQQHLERLVEQAWDAIRQNAIREYINHISTISNLIISNNGWENIG
ncbi:unnamed protein product [Rotaria magnacalcarata]|uniref:Tc1-like transposase DDE domain-containing protein n=1 Tax=Rotaria magnacalcarata TaxID=392030 RepID=A0A819ZHB7_9BILA|nr:unnamed protein product [Rotaria magnacalcarata]